MIYFYYGEDSFRSKQMVDRLTEKFITQYDPQGHNVISLSDAELTLENFFTAARSQGFFEKKKLLIIKNIFTHPKLRDLQDHLIDYLDMQKNTTDEHYLIFWQDGSPRKNLKLVTYLSERCNAKCVQSFEPLNGDALQRWITQEASRYEKTIAPAAITRLIELSGEETWKLHHEIHKLAFATEASEITADDVDRIAAARRVDVLFPFLDAVGMRERKNSLHHLHALLQNQSDTGYLVNMLIRQFRLIARAKAEHDAGTNSFAIAQRLKLPPFIAKKILAQSERFTKKDLSSVYDNLLGLDRLLKSSPDRVEAALVDLVAQSTR